MRWLFTLLIAIVIVGLSVWIKSNNMSTEGFVLKALTQVKKARGKVVNTSDFTKTSLTAPQHTIWDTLLQKNVTPSGDVDYLGFMASRSELQEYLNVLSVNAPSDQWTIEEKLAYWVNAYNAFTVELILMNWPVKSIKDIGGNLPMVNSPWDIQFFQIGGLDFDLNTIEHQILREKFEEPRIHFAINCASESCPVLRNEAYTSSNLESQLKDQTHLFLSESSKNRMTKDQAELSSIFKWFSEDFGGEAGVKDFIRSNSNIDLKDIDISYQDYDWGLNSK